MPKHAAFLLFVPLLLAIGCDLVPATDSAASEAPTAGGAMHNPPDWDSVEKLIGEQKFEQAAAEVALIRDSARAAKDNDEWTKALVKETQLRMALHGYETAVRFLMEEPWPDYAISRATLNLFYAHSLTTYIQAYSWEIGQREKVVSTQEVDLKKWTREQLFTEAQRAYVEVWNLRQKLGKESISLLSRYMMSNNYPEEVRGTLRHAATYLFVELLGNSSNWRPEHSNEIWTLDLPALIQGDQKQSCHIDLSDPEAHPLRKICALLDDLEQWTSKSKQQAASLEARLERLRRLWASFTQEPDRELIRRDLERTLPDYRRIDWWAEGMAQLAEFVKQENDPNNLRRARALADKGWKVYPNSVGGQHCQAIVKGIEAPAYRMTAMKSDGLGKRSVEISHKNLSTLFFRAYRLDLVKWLETAEDWNLLPGGRDIQEIVKTRHPVMQWRADLLATPDFHEHRTFVTPPMESHGFCIIVSSANESFDPGDNRLFAVPMLFTDLVLLSRPDGFGGQEARLVSGAGGVPIEGARVTLYKRDWHKGHHRLKTLISDRHGLVNFRAKDHKDSHQNFLFAEYEDDVALDDTNLWFHKPSPPSETTASLIYTDRSVYRPTQKILWKVLVYRGRNDVGRFRTLPDASVTVSLIDPNNQTVESKVLTTNTFGSAADEFIIPSGRPLGGWRLQSSLSGSQQIRVEEYKRPTFEASFKDPTKPLRLNMPAVMTGEVRYYFGLPVVNGTVKWRVTRVPVYPWWWGWWWGGRAAAAQTQIVAMGTAELAEDGAFQVEFTPNADERLAELSKETSYRFVLTADITDEGGETRSASRSFRLGFISVEAQISLTGGFVREDMQPGLTIRRSNLDGIGRAGSGSWRLYALRQPEEAVLPAEEPMPLHAPGQTAKADDAYHTPGDVLRPRWEQNYQPERAMHTWRNGDELDHGKVEHEESGMASVTLKTLPPGPYRIAYTTVDDFGATFETSKEFVVAGHDTHLALPALLLVERTSLPVGETARLLVLSGLDDQKLFLDVFKAGKVIERRVLQAGTDETIIEIPIEKDDRGGFGVTLTAVRDHQLLQFSQSIYVPWDDRRLEVSFATFRDKIRPGGHETWTVTVKGAGKTPSEAGAAELLAYMYDKSLDIFAFHSPPSPLSLYPYKTGTSYTRASLGAVSGIRFINSNFRSPPGYPSLYGDQLLFYSGYGIGGPGRRGVFRGAQTMAMPMATFAEVPEAQTSVREKSIEVDQEGDEFKSHKAGLAGLDAVNGSDRSSAIALEEAKEEMGVETPEQTLRSDFAETAFWEPQLLLGPDGAVAIEFDVPDPVTAWNVWVHAVTRDLKAGSLQRETRSVKELMVRPYVPRFLREGDKAQIKVVVNNASEEEFKGRLNFDIFDPETNASLLADFGFENNGPAREPFTVKAGGGTTLTFSITAPKKVGIVAFKIIAEAGDFSDGELRPLPVLPSRIHLAQSRFVTLRNKDRRVMRFDDLAQSTEDPTLINEQLVVTVDAQLFYTVLQALPYLVNYPYECTEQTLNRFVSTGIVSTLYKDYPAIARMAEEFSKRETRYETFDQADPNRRMALEETPWLQMAKGGRESGSGLINVLDPKIAKANRDVALAKLRKAQTSLGAFPWFPGGPPSPYMTLYIMHGFAKAMEFGVDVPEDMVRRGWSYLAKYYRDRIQDMMARDCCWEFLTFLNYVASCYQEVSWTGDMLTQSEREQILAFTFKHWKDHSPYLKGYLALTLKRMGREPDAHLVWESVMDAAKTTDDQGTFWAPEDRSWLWYNDTIETHAFALRTLMELKPGHQQRDGLVQWLLLNKKLNQWKSTKATAEVIYSLIHYLKAEGALGITEDATVTIGTQTVTFTFEPDKYTGKKNQIIVPGEKVGPETATVVVVKESKGFAFASATWHFSTEELPEEDRGDFFAVSRQYFKRENTGREFVLTPLDEGTHIAIGDQIEVHISLRSKHRAEYVHLRDPRAAGLEPENAVSRYKWDLGIGWYEETRDSGSNFFFESLPVGEYTFKYRLRANMAGTFRVGPATVQSMYAPEFNAYSSGAAITISEEG